MIDLLNKQNNQLDRTIMKNKSLKRVLVFFITAVTIVSSVTIADMRYVKAETSWPTGIDVTAEAVEVMDIDTGTVLYQKNPDIVEFIKYIDGPKINRGWLMHNRTLIRTGFDN